MPDWRSASGFTADSGVPLIHRGFERRSPRAARTAPLPLACAPIVSSASNLRESPTRGLLECWQLPGSDIYRRHDHTAILEMRPCCEGGEFSTGEMGDFQPALTARRALVPGEAYRGLASDLSLWDQYRTSEAVVVTVGSYRPKASPIPYVPLDGCTIGAICG